MDLDLSQAVISSPESFQNPGCPSPQPFVQNINSSVALLRSNSFNGTQPEDAGNYTCYSNGLPRVTVEIVVLGTINLFFMLVH